MLLTENNKTLSFTITGYQYPNIASTEKEYNHDANWLNCEIRYVENGVENSQVDACLTTFELQFLTKSLKNIIDGINNEYETDHLEPYLQIFIAREYNKIRFIVEYEYEFSDEEEKVWKINSLVDKDTAKQFLKELEELTLSYPER